MRVSVVRGGGFAGLTTTTTADTEVLAPEHAKDLHAKVAEAKVFELPESLSGPTAHPDRFNYSVTVEDEDRSHTVSCSEENLPGALKELISWVNAVPGSASKIG